jgi:predicted transcriptional regulator
VGANDGQGVSQVAAGSGVALKLAKKVVAKLIASGQLKKTGQKRGTKYHIGSGRAPRVKAGKSGRRKA